MKPALLCLAGALLWSADAPAQSVEYQRAQTVVERQTLMFTLQDDYWVLLDLRNGKTGDYAGAGLAARRLAAGMTAFTGLLPEGTERGAAPGSRARPEVWTDPAGFAGKVAAFGAASERLTAAAETAQAGEYAAAFDAFTEACTGCHGLRPSSGGPFRFAPGE